MPGFPYFEKMLDRSKLCQDNPAAIEAVLRFICNFEYDTAVEKTATMNPKCNRQTRGVGEAGRPNYVQIQTIL